METTQQTVEQSAEQTQQTEQTQQETSTSQEQTVETPSTEASTSTQNTEAQAVTEPTTPFELPLAQQQDPLEGVAPEVVASRFKDNKQALLKALGYDDFALGALEYYERTGDMTPYLEVKTVDYAKLPDEAIVERKLREQYSAHGLAEEELQLLVQDEMKSRFKQDEVWSDSEQRLGKIRMKAEAAEFRRTLTERQSQFRAPEREAAQEPTYEQKVEATRNVVLQDKAVQQFLQQKVIPLGEASSPYNYEVPNPADTLSILYDTNKYLYHVAQKNEQGQVVMRDGQVQMDWGKMLRVAAYVQNMEEVEKRLVAHGMTLGKKAALDEAENIPSGQNVQTGQSEPDDLFKALNRRLMGQ